jgi:hypothetical protein
MGQVETGGQALVDPSAEVGEIALIVLLSVVAETVLAGVA